MQTYLPDPPEGPSDAVVIEHPSMGGGFRTPPEVTNSEQPDDEYRLNLKEDIEDGGDDVNESGDDYGGKEGV